MRLNEDKIFMLFYILIKNQIFLKVVTLQSLQTMYKKFAKGFANFLNLDYLNERLISFLKGGKGGLKVSPRYKQKFSNHITN